MTLQPATLAELNVIFGTAARAHEFDKRFLIGETLSDLRLAFVPGVKAVYVPDMGKALSGKTREDRQLARTNFRTEIDTALTSLAGRLSSGYRNVNTSTNKNDWHIDGFYYRNGEYDYSLNNARVRFLIAVNNLGTECLLGSLPKELVEEYSKLITEPQDIFVGDEDLNLIYEAIEEGHLKPFQCAPLSCLAISGFPSLPKRDTIISAFAEAVEICQLHRAPRNARGFKLRLCDDFRRTETPLFAFAPA